MSEKKVVRRIVALALGVICIILIAGLGGAIAYYDATYDDYVSTHSHTDSDYNSLNSTYYNYVGNHHYSDSEYNSLNSSYANLQATTDQLQTWLNGNVTSLEAQISTLNSTITQMGEWLARGPLANHSAVADKIQALYPANISLNISANIYLTRQFLFSCIDDEGTESNWVWLWVNGSISDAAAFMSIIIKRDNTTSIEFCRCDGDPIGATLCININGKFYDNIFSNFSERGLIGYWSG